MSYDSNTVTNVDQSTFNSVSPSGTVNLDTDPNGQTVLILPGLGWIYIKGSQPKAQTSNAVAGASSSEMLIQTTAGSGSNPSKTRFLLVNSSGTATVSLIDDSNSVTFAAGHCVDVTNSDPPVLGTVQTYNSVTMSQTRNTLSLAQSQYTAIFET